MPDPDAVLAVVHEWVEKAENDLRNAAHTLKLGEDCPTDTVCFHAQQCVEKYVKALLVLRGVDFPKTHDLDKLQRLLPGETRLSLSEEERGRLTDYATVGRYPGWGQIPLPRHARRWRSLGRLASSADGTGRDRMRQAPRSPCI